MSTYNAQIAMSGFAHRMHVYFCEMFPIPARMLNAILLFISFSAMLTIIYGTAVEFDWRMAILGSFNAFTIALILRLMDELKDLDIDCRLFCGRPVPSGQVHASDIKFSLIITVVLFALVNMIVQTAFWSALGLLTYSFLMFRYFFLPNRLHEKLLVNLATHNPIVALLLLYFIHLHASWQGLKTETLFQFQSIVLVGMYWGLFLSWEIARKIRYSREENEYVTYSRIFGRTGATLIAGLVQSFSCLAGLWLSYHSGFSPVYVGVLLIGFVMLVITYVRFLRSELPSSRQLKTAAERYAAIVMSAPLVEMLVKGIMENVSF